jgi:hypothetical protein
MGYRGGMRLPLACLMVTLMVPSFADGANPPGTTISAPTQPPGEAPPTPPAAPVATLPDELPYEEGQPVPAGYHYNSKPRVGLIIAGSVTFGISYSLTAFVTLIVGAFRGTQAQPMYIPVIGPLVEGIRSPGALPVLGLSTLLQGAGVGMLVAGIVAKREFLERNGSSSQKESPYALKPSWTPILGPRMVGIGGTF